MSGRITHGLGLSQTSIAALQCIHIHTTTIYIYQKPPLPFDRLFFTAIKTKVSHQVKYCSWSKAQARLSKRLMINIQRSAGGLIHVMSLTSPMLWFKFVFVTFKENTVRHQRASIISITNQNKKQTQKCRKITFRNGVCGCELVNLHNKW